jgi:hypothetical protein
LERTGVGVPAYGVLWGQIAEVGQGVGRSTAEEDPGLLPVSRGTVAVQYAGKEPEQGGSLYFVEYAIRAMQ